MKTLVVLYPNFRAADLDVMDYIDPRSEEEKSLAVVRFGQSSTPTQLPTKFGEVSVLDGSTALSKTFDLLIIPGSEVSTGLNDAILGPEDDASIRGLLDKATWKVALGLGTILMARSGFPDEYPTMRGLFSATPAGANLDDIREKYRAVKWVDIRTVKTAGIWSSRAASAEDIRSLGILLNHSLRHPMSMSHLYPPSLLIHGDQPPPPTSTDEMSDKPRIPFPGSDISADIEACTKDEDVVQTASYFALLLAMETFVGSCNDIMTTLFDAFPNCSGSVNPHVLNGLEYYWDASGMRPEAPWEKPDLDKVSKLKETQWQEIDEEEESRVLEFLACQADLGDFELKPYGLEMAASLAVKHGREDFSRVLLDALARRLRDSDHLLEWVMAAKWRPLCRPILDGAITRWTGRTAEIAQEESDKVSQTLRAWHEHNQQSKTRRVAQRQTIHGFSFPQLLERLEERKSEDQTTIRKAPASQSEIQATEERLDIQLPDDYKAFMLVSNGLDFIPGINKPGSRPLSELKWQSAEELGLDEFRIELGEGLDPAEVEKMPRMGRLLMISSEDDEEILCLVEPAQMDAAKETLNKERGQKERDNAFGQWGLFFWVNWMPNMLWHSNFRAYLESLVA